MRHRRRRILRRLLGILVYAAVLALSLLGLFVVPTWLFAT